MTNREAIHLIVKAFGIVGTSAVRHILSLNQIDLSIDEINYELNMLLAEDKVYQHNHPAWPEPCWVDPEMSKAMLKLWGERAPH